MVASLIFETFKYILTLLILIAGHILYQNVAKPFMFRQKYKKYANVYMIKKYTPFLGDLSMIIENVKKNYAFTHYLKTLHKETNGHDLRVDIYGSTRIMTILSHKALKETIEQMPHTIDRADIQRRYDLKRGLCKLADGCFVNLPSSQRTRDRRKSYFKILGLNSASKHIPLMLENIMEVCSQKGEVNMLNAMTTCTNKVLMSILFGKDLKHLFYNTYEYEGPNGTEHLNISEYFGKMGHDLSRESVNPLTLFFPLLTKFNPFGIWKKNQENTQRFYSAVKDIISRSQDEESLWNQISSLNQFTEDEIFSDLIVLIGAGSETAAHTLVAILYYLKKFPNTAKKLKSELDKIGIRKGCNLEETFTMDNLQE